MLALHRPWMTKAIDSEGGPFESEYAASFSITLEIARKQAAVTRAMLDRAPEALYGWWLFFREWYSLLVVYRALLISYSQPLQRCHRSGLRPA
jgi:hypothetical protein